MSIYTRYCTPVRGPADADWLKKIEVRERRQLQRNTWLPSLSGLRSRDPQRKTRLSWLRTIAMARMALGLASLKPSQREERRRWVANAAQLLRDYPWGPVLP